MKLGARVSSWIDGLFKPKNPDDKQPSPVEEAEKDTPKKVSMLYIIWQLWRKKIDVDAIVPLLVLAPFLLFFAASGVLAWLAVVACFVWQFFQTVFL
jgi:hypothetical protein